MEITLKKAGTLAAQLGAVVVNVPATLSVSKYSDQAFEELVTQGEAAFAVALQTRLQAIQAQYKLRALIGVANADNAGQVDNLLAQRAMLDAELKVLNAVTQRKVAPDYPALQKQRAAMLERETYGGDSIDLNVAPAEQVQPLIAERTKARAEIQDLLVGLNFTTKLQVPEDVVAVLRYHNLV
jgi:hypothetical protein